LLDAGMEQAPTPFVVVHNAGEVAEEVCDTVNHLSGRVEAPGRDVLAGQIGAKNGGAEVDVVQHFGGTNQDPSRHAHYGGALPIWR
jgi:hypothetical protein